MQEESHVSSTTVALSHGAAGTSFLPRNSSRVSFASFDPSISTIAVPTDVVAIVVSKLASASASFTETSPGFIFGETDIPAVKVEAINHIPLHTLTPYLQHLTIRSKNQDTINSFTNMFDTVSISGSKRTREAEEDEPADYKNHMSERRTARARDNSTTYDFAANNISKNSLNSTSFFVQFSNPSSRARSNALSVPQTNLTPYPSDTEEAHSGSGFAKIPNLSLRSGGATLNPFSAAQSPAESFDSSQHEIGDSQNTSMITEDSQNDFAMDMDVDDAPVVSPGASFSQPNNFGSSHTQTHNHWQVSGRLPSPAVSEDAARVHRSSSLDGDNFGQMGMQLHGTRQDAQGQWNSRANSFGGSQNLGHVATGMGPPPQKKKGGRLVMGYRADCKKCRDKVSGHYNHFL